MAELSHIDFDDESLEIADEAARKNIASLQDDFKKIGDAALTNATIRYVNDGDDENFGWIQIKNEDGTWTNWKCAYVNGRYLFFNGDEFVSETGGFTKYSGDGTITNDGVELKIVGLNDTTKGHVSYFGTNSIIDLSMVERIEVVFSADLTKGSYNGFSFGISSTKGGEFVAVREYVWNNKYTDETVTFDVSNIDSGYFQIYEKSGYATVASIRSIKLIQK